MVSGPVPTRVRIAVAALDFIDEHGVDALTLRALGQSTDMHHTAIYRHYANRDEVLGAAMGIVIQEALDRAQPLPTDPRDRLLSLARSLRAAFHEHPAVSFAYLLPHEVIAQSAAAATFVGEVLQALQDLGLSGDALAVHFRLLEGYVLGMTSFDFSGAPDHLESRRQRYRQFPDQAFEIASRDVEGIDALNEVAFDRGLVILVDACIASAR